MKIDNIKLSRLVSHALRHEPRAYNLKVDEEGWVKIDSLVESIKCKEPKWCDLSIQHLEKMIEFSSKKRHEIKGGKIRAIYGHSLEIKITHKEVVPPQTLFHSTSLEASKIILKEGLKSMKRQYVHMSVDKDIAMNVGLRKSKNPIILVIDSKFAYEKGTKFYYGGDGIFLASEIKCQYIKL